MKNKRTIEQQYPDKPRRIDQVLFEQYKMFVDSAEKVSVKRQDANKFYLTVNSVLFSTASYLSTLNAALPPILISFAGLVTCWSWIRVISSHGQLNAAKFKIIHRLEKRLPVALFALEHEQLTKDGYYLLTKAEKKVPLAFIALHIAVIIIVMTKTANVWWPFLQNLASSMKNFLPH